MTLKNFAKYGSSLNVHKDPKQRRERRPIIEENNRQDIWFDYPEHIAQSRYQNKPRKKLQHIRAKQKPCLSDAIYKTTSEMN